MPKLSDYLHGITPRVIGPSAYQSMPFWYVNSFYPANVPSPTLSSYLGSRPLSSLYSSLAQAQTFFPYLNFSTRNVQLSDEIDWCAIQSCLDYITSKPQIDLPNGPPRYVATILFNGKYVINRTINVTDFSSIEFDGCHQCEQSPVETGTSISYNGSFGTVDTPIPMILYTPPVDMGGGGIFRCHRFSFLVVGGVTGFTDFSQATFVTGIQLKASQFSEIYDNCFNVGLWDGIQAIDAQLFLRIHHNLFYGVNRDAISICAIKNTFSTTMWINNNEYGAVGRYAILMDCLGSIEPLPIIQDEDWEFSYPSSYFINNPEWYVHGAVCASVFINCGQGVIENVRSEALSDQTAGMYADVHLIMSGGFSIENGTLRNLLCSFMANSRETAAATAYKNANGYLDITNQRNYNCGSAGDFVDSQDQLQIHGIKTALWLADGKGISTSNNHNFDDCELNVYSIPVIAGTYASGVVTPRTTAKPKLITLSNSHFINTQITGSDGTRDHLVFDPFTESGIVRLIQGNAVIPTWQALHTYSPQIPGESRLNYVVPVTQNGFIFQCTVGGISGALEPVWPTTIGNSVVDGGVTWLCAGTAYIGSDDNKSELWISNHRTRYGTAAPSDSSWTIGDRVINSSPSVGQPKSWVCTVSGVPGTWVSEGNL